MSASASVAYARLLSDRRPRAIHGRRDYKAAMREIHELMILQDRRSRAETEYFELLLALIMEYEHRIGADIWPKVPPVDALRELMDFMSISQTQVASALGSRSAASHILSGRRQISKTQAKKLGALFRVDAGIFI
jgi:HTH-type transcriptional regulator / antitoxin HigA